MLEEQHHDSFDFSQSKSIFKYEALIKFRFAILPRFHS